MDVEAVLAAATAAVDRRARAAGPTFLECRTYRFFGHHTAERTMKLGYRTDEEIARWRERDPLIVTAGSTLDDAAERDAHRRRGRGAARRRRRIRPRERAARPVRCPRTTCTRAGSAPRRRSRAVTRMRYLQALAKALRDEMERDPKRVRGRRGRTRIAARGHEGPGRDFDDRVLDMPISEQMFTGFATGAALAGHRAVVEFQIPALLYIAFEQIVNQAQKLRLMTGGQASVPVVYVVPGSGARLGLAAQHSDHPYSLFVHAGVKTVLPATPRRTPTGCSSRRFATTTR